jgi:hypothetical protein
MATEVERTQLGERKAAFEPSEHVSINPPADTAVFIALVVQRKSGFLKRGEVAANGASGDVELAGETVNRRAVTR